MTIQRSSSKGGARPGAGRPKDDVVKLRKSVAQDLLSPAKEKAMSMLFLSSTDENIAFKSFVEWNNRAYGKPAQAVDVTTKGEAITQVIVNL